MSTVNVQFLAETRGIRRGIDEVNGRLGKLGGTFRKVAGAATLLFGVGAAVQFGKDIVDSASKSQQSIGATEQVFGKMADTVIKRSDEASKSLGLSANEYRELANVMGASFTAVGTPLKKATKLSDELIKRGADMSATFGGTTKDAVEALTSAFRGEFDPIERYGVSIKQSDVNARLASKGLDKLEGSQRKVAEKQAIYDLVMQQTGKTQGQFGRESDTLAGKQQRVAAQWENLKVKLGNALLPILTKVFEYISAKVIPTLEKWWPSVQRVFGNIGDGVGKLKEFYQSFSESTKANGLMGTFLDTAKSVFGSVKSIISSVVSIVRTLWAKFGDDILAYLVPALKLGFQFIKGTFTAIAGVFKTIAAVLKGDWKGAWEGIKQITTGGGNATKALTKGIWNTIKFLITLPMKAALAILKGIWSLIKLAASALGRAVASAVKAGFDRAKSAAVGAMQGLLSQVKALPGRIKAGLGNLASLLYSAGQDLIQGLIRGIRSLAGQVAAEARRLADNAIATIKNALKIASPSKVMIGIGRFVGQGLALGMSGTVSQVRAAGFKLVNAVQDAFIGYKNSRNTLDKRLAQQMADYRKADGDRRKTLAKSIATTRAQIKALDKSYTGPETTRGMSKFVTRISKLNAKLLRNASQREQAAKKLAAAQASLAAAIKVRDEYAASVRDNALSFANITSIQPGENESLTAKTLIQGLRDRLNAITNYTAKLRALAAKGLNKATYDQLVQAGVEGGTAAVEALTAGGNSAISQVNYLQRSISANANLLGTQTSRDMYQAGVNAAAGLVKGLQSQTAALAKAAAAMAARLTKAVKKALKIKSPSRVFRYDIASNVVDGFILGLDTDAIGKQGRAMSNALTRSFNGTQLHANASLPLAAPAAGKQNIYVHLTADTLTELERGLKVSKELRAAQRVGVTV